MLEYLIIVIIEYFDPELETGSCVDVKIEYRVTLLVRLDDN